MSMSSAEKDRAIVLQQSIDSLASACFDCTGAARMGEQGRCKPTTVGGGHWGPSCGRAPRQT
jgi:hypothetical protein